MCGGPTRAASRRWSSSTPSWAGFLLCAWLVEHHGVGRLLVDGERVRRQSRGRHQQRGHGRVARAAGHREVDGDDDDDDVTAPNTVEEAVEVTVPNTAALKKGKRAITDVVGGQSAWVTW